MEKLKGKRVKFTHELVTVSMEFKAFYVTEKLGRLALSIDMQVRKPAGCCTETQVSGHEVLTVHYRQNLSVML